MPRRLSRSQLGPVEGLLQDAWSGTRRGVPQRCRWWNLRASGNSGHVQCPTDDSIRLCLFLRRAVGWDFAARLGDGPFTCTRSRSRSSGEVVRSCGTSSQALSRLVAAAFDLGRVLGTPEIAWRWRSSSRRTRRRPSVWWVWRMRVCALSLPVRAVLPSVIGALANRADVEEGTWALLALGPVVVGVADALALALALVVLPA